MNKYYDPHEDPNYRDELCIGSINFETDILDSLVENQIGTKIKIPKIGECKVEVYGKEGSIPHFHVFNLNKSFETCVCIYTNNYFVHGKYKDTFNQKQVNQLVTWLQSPSILNQDITNWKVIVMFWEGANPECKFPKSSKVTTMPDYTKLNDTAKVY